MNSSPEERQKITDRAWVRVLLFLVSYFIFNSLMQMGGLYVMSIFSELPFSEYATSFQKQVARSDLPLTPMLVLQSAGLIGTLILVALFRRKLDRQSVASLGLRIKGWYRDAGVGFLLGVVLIGTGFLTLSLSGYLSIESIHFNPGALLLSLVFFLVVSLNEEIMLRGYVLNNLLKQYHPYHALGVTAFLFSVMHGINPNITIIGFLNIFLAGVLFGIYYIHRRNLWFPIMIHLSWNFFQGPILGFEVSGIRSKSILDHHIDGPFYITGGSFGFEGSLLLSLLLIISIWWIHHRYRES